MRFGNKRSDDEKFLRLQATYSVIRRFSCQRLAATNTSSARPGSIAPIRPAKERTRAGGRAGGKEKLGQSR